MGNDNNSSLSRNFCVGKFWLHFEVEHIMLLNADKFQWKQAVKKVIKENHIFSKPDIC